MIQMKNRAKIMMPISSVFFGGESWLISDHKHSAPFPPLAGLQHHPLAIHRNWQHWSLRQTGKHVKSLSHKKLIITCFVPLLNTSVTENIPSRLTDPQKTTGQQKAEIRAFFFKHLVHIALGQSNENPFSCRRTGQTIVAVLSCAACLETI
ncbi:hypothetical protein ATANTOWER_001294 [Ataeniobius toweri]|uniref:Uncharacterized protein n=1 Tax=Ataeniobius toweri TaxID=208326 RepID=A0ABU7A4W5_9TELE|nr:hypothetical protein [Ataeniobius toweri]